MICFCAKCGLVVPELGSDLSSRGSNLCISIPSAFWTILCFLFHSHSGIDPFLSLHRSNTARQLSSRHHNFCFSSSSSLADLDLCVTGYSKFFSGSVKDHLYCEALSVVKKRALLIQCVLKKPKIPQSPDHARIEK